MSSQESDALAFFLPNSTILSMEPLGDGNVNDTWRVGVKPDKIFVLQRLNPHVFVHPKLVQDNLAVVTGHLKVALAKINADFIPVRLIEGPDGENSFIAGDGSWWRLLSYINNSTSTNRVHSPNQARETGKTLGLFHQLVSSLDTSALADPLPGFHCTPLYLDEYDRIAAHASAQKQGDCRDFIHERRKYIFLLENARQQGLIRQQVVHGDPKVANFLFSKDYSRVISLIDLDTVRPGLLLHDIGDFLRSCCNEAGEEVHDVQAVHFSPELFSAALSGYLQCASTLLTPEDNRSIVHSARLLSFELGLRFYSDYLAGNKYFKVSHSNHNLFRARIQFALVQSIEAQYSELKQICSALLAAVPAV